MKPVYKKALALALSLGTLGALVAQAALTGCHTSEGVTPSAERVAGPPSPSVSTPASAAIAVTPATGTTTGDAAPAPSPATPTPPTSTGAARAPVESPEWLPASKAGPVFRPKSTPTAQKGGAP
ncbi:MAG: hypothetical protein U0414_25740 [Polyangiaceae bacterium]